MTDHQYKELQAWCKSNLERRIKPELYKEKVELRNKATSIRRTIFHYKKAIKDAMRVLEVCKEKNKIAKWKMIVEENKEYKRIAQQEFENLNYPYASENS